MHQMSQITAKIRLNTKGQRMASAKGRRATRGKGNADIEGRIDDEC